MYIINKQGDKNYLCLQMYKVCVIRTEPKVACFLLYGFY